MKIYTLGYGGRAPSEFVKLLTERGVRTLVDCRLRPDKTSYGAYARSSSSDRGIEKLLGDQGIAYVSRVELGNIFMEQDEWWKQYKRLLDLAGDLLLESISGLDDPICLLCAERDATKCHRGLIAETLAERGHEVTHIE